MPTDFIGGDSVSSVPIGKCETLYADDKKIVIMWVINQTAYLNISPAG